MAESISPKYAILSLRVALTNKVVTEFFIFERQHHCSVVVVNCVTHPRCGAELCNPSSLWCPMNVIHLVVVLNIIVTYPSFALFPALVYLE